MPYEPQWAFMVPFGLPWTSMVYHGPSNGPPWTPMVPNRPLIDLLEPPLFWRATYEIILLSITCLINHSLVWSCMVNHGPVWTYHVPLGSPLIQYCLKNNKKKIIKKGEKIKKMLITLFKIETHSTTDS